MINQVKHFGDRKLIREYIMVKWCFYTLELSLGWYKSRDCELQCAVFSLIDLDYINVSCTASCDDEDESKTNWGMKKRYPIINVSTMWIHTLWHINTLQYIAINKIKSQLKRCADNTSNNTTWLLLRVAQPYFILSSKRVVSGWNSSQLMWSIWQMIRLCNGTSRVWDIRGRPNLIYGREKSEQSPAEHEWWVKSGLKIGRGSKGVLYGACQGGVMIAYVTMRRE